MISRLQMELHSERKARLARMAPRPRLSVVPRPIPTPAIEPEPPKPIWFHILSDGPWFEKLAEGLVQPSPKKPPEPAGALFVADIQRAVARHFDITLRDLTSARRTGNVVRPRQIAMYLARKLTGRSLPDIGRRTGGRDHTTVLHAVTVCERILEGNEEYASDIRELLEQLEPAS